MDSTTTRRQLLFGAGSALATACAGSMPPGRRAGLERGSRALDAVESRVGGRVGVFALDTGTGRQLSHRADERFAMCSTFKLLLAATVLARADRKLLSLTDRVAIAAVDLVEHAPITSEHVDGVLSIDALAEAAVTVSDNTAANLLLARIDGPPGLTQFARELGDAVTRLDRTEPSLNANAPNDPRDTTSPRAMVGTMRALLVGDVLSPTSRERLLGWLRACSTGKDRLRGGFPEGWAAGDKTGTGARASVNDLAIAWPPGRKPILVAAYLSDSDTDLPALVAAHADIGRIVAREL